MSKKKYLCILLLLLFFVSVAYGESTPDIQEGQWQITMEMEIPTMPMKMPPTTYNQCITKKDVIPQGTNQNGACKQNDVTIKGNTVTWVVICDSTGGQMTGKGSITYHKNKMEGTMTTEGQGVKMISHFKGHRLGDCVSK